jgi:hypothetical protein
MADMTHYGSVAYRQGRYEKVSGSDNWSIKMIGGAPLGQIRIVFENSIAGAYSILVTAEQSPNAPLMAANYGNATHEGFSVHLWESVADRTVMNSGFSFVVLHT